MKRGQLPSYIVRNSRGVLYFRKRGTPWVRLETQFPAGEAVPFSLHQERERLLNEPRPVPKGETVADVIRHYHASEGYRKLAPRTKSDYDKRTDFWRDAIGHLRPKNIERRHVVGWRDASEKKSGPHEANYRLRVLRILMEHAINMGHLPSGANPVSNVPQIKYEGKVREPWPIEKVKAFRDAYPRDTVERLIFELCIGTGQRISDVLKMQWGDLDGDAIRVRQNKTKKRLHLPFTSELRATLAVTPRRALFIVPAEKGTAQRTYFSAAYAMRQARDKIDARAWDLHSLRYYAAAELLLAGCTDDEIAAVTGQSPEMVRHYTAAVRQKVRAIKAQKDRG
jgi:integrase